MYSDLFCKVYHVFGWNYYPEIFGQQLLLWLQEKGIRPKTCLDLGCGTGTLTELLDSRGYNMIGVDVSEDMLSVAMDKRTESGKDILSGAADSRTCSSVPRRRR